MLLSPARAWELLRDHTAILHGQLSWAYTLDVDTGTLPTLQFVSTDVLRDGARVRLAWDLILTLRACRGLAPTENPSFWRRALIELLLERASSDPQQRASSSSYHTPQRLHVALGGFVLPRLWDLHTRPEASAFWRDYITCGVHSQEVSAIAVQHDREALARELAPFVVWPVKPLELHAWYYAREVPNTLRAANRAYYSALALGTIARCKPPSQTASDAIAAVISSFVEGAPTTRVHGVAIFGGMDWISPCTTSRNGRNTWLRFLRNLVGLLPRIPVLNLRCGREPLEVFGAILSIVPHSALTRTIPLVDRLIWDVRATEDKLLRLAWLAYAIFHPISRRSPMQSIAIRPDLKLSDTEYIDTIVRVGMPLRDVVHVALRNRYGPRSSLYQVESYSFGVHAIVAQGTALYCEPSRTTAQYVVVTTSHDEEVDVVARVGMKGFVGIVYTGMGLLWAQEADVSLVPPTGPAWHVGADSPVGTLLATTRLYLALRKTAQPCYPPRSPLSVFLSPQLRSLELLHYSPLEACDLELILALCPNLHRLELIQCIIQSLWPLLDAYTSEERPCRVSCLRLASAGSSLASIDAGALALGTGAIMVTHANVFGPLMDALCDASHPLTQRLRVLHVDVRGTGQEDQAVEQLFRALRMATTRLEALTLTTQATSASYVARGLSPHRDHVLVDVRRMRLALLSVLMVRGRWSSATQEEASEGGDATSQSLCEESLRLVFTFAGGSVRRHINWAFRPLQFVGGSVH